MTKNYFIKILIFNYLYISVISAQSVKQFIPISGDIGVTFVQTERSGFSSWNGVLGNNIRLQSGYSLLVNERFGFLTEGGLLLNNYSFSNDNDDSYQISHIMATVAATPYFLIPFNAKLQTSIHIGLSGGYNFRGDNTLNRKEDNFEALTETRGPGNFYIRPEFGLTKGLKNGNMSLTISYQHQFLRSEIPFQSIIADNSGSFIAKNKGNYIALSLRHEFYLGKRKKKVTHFIPTPTENIDFEKRITLNISKYRTRRQYVKMEIYESSIADNDIISLSVNGQFLLHNFKITRDKKTIKIPLEKGLNLIKVYAVNEGDIPPNTGSCILHINGRKKRFQIQTGLQKNASIEIEKI